MKTLTIVGVALLALTTHGTAAAAEKNGPVAVYLAPPTGEFQDPQRLESTRDVRARIGYLAKKEVKLVDRREDAAVVIEVVDRRESNAEKVIVATLTVGAYTMTLEGHDTPLLRIESSWKVAARDVVFKLRQFIVANYEKLTKRP